MEGMAGSELDISAEAHLLQNLPTQPTRGPVRAAAEHRRRLKEVPRVHRPKEVPKLRETHLRKTVQIPRPFPPDKILLPLSVPLQILFLPFHRPLLSLLNPLVPSTSSKFHRPDNWFIFDVSP
jgi:hypothetical protein